jgi:hypothetical protein
MINWTEQDWIEATKDKPATRMLGEFDPLFKKRFMDYWSELMPLGYES